ncbi:MAG: type II toxin-antitoxin system RelE/ParE family toxin [Arcobacteraceae bacterium]|jgi:mRNA interferase RelE/StbE|nr:type II toxin-antitoxin system RelE/ParE family toxin [Arcobacteraceae bacterium]MDY0364523.1 type II toxin-antitoxin system RelE/ParE family toxin [Arcobacteraceae bacterium]
MIYDLDFKPKALKEWKKLDSTIKEQFKKKLEKIIINPKIAKNRLSGYENIYKIKLLKAGYRLVYEVKEKEIVVLVLTIGKRENDKVYDKLRSRVSSKS